MTTELTTDPTPTIEATTDLKLTSELTADQKPRKKKQLTVSPKPTTNHLPFG